MIDGANHRLILQEETLFVRMRILHVHTGQKVLLLSAPLVLQLYSERNIFTQVFDALVFITIEILGYLLFRRRAIAETRKVKAMLDNWLPSLGLLEDCSYLD